LSSSDPADGASLTSAPREVVLTFETPVQEFAAVTVTGPHGDRWERGPATVTGDTVTVELEELERPGRYVVAYRIVSADGHPVSDTVEFELTAATTTPSQTPADEAAPPAAAGNQSPADGAGGSSAPVWPWLAGIVVGIVVLAAAGVGVALRLGRR
jgi:methionine-rich copper-binding protein CopC